MPNVNEKHYDRRIYDRYISKGQVTKEQFEKHMKQLPDEAANAQYVQLDIHDTELGESLSDSDSPELT